MRGFGRMVARLARWRSKAALAAASILGTLIIAAAFAAVEVSVREVERDGAPAAQVLVGSALVIELVRSAGGYSPLERAAAIADRLEETLESELRPSDLSVSRIGGGHALYGRDRMIAAAYAVDAGAAETTTRRLALKWRDNLAAALTGSDTPATTGPATASGSPSVAATGRGEVDWSGTAQKWVPIFSLETEGLYVGAAQVAGPTAQVEKVKGVAELRLDFQGVARIYAYVPTSTISLTKLERVQGVSVWATGDLQLVEF